MVSHDMAHVFYHFLLCLLSLQDDDDNESLTGMGRKKQHSDRARPEPVGKDSGTDNDTADIGIYEMNYVNPDFQDPTEVS